MFRPRLLAALTCSLCLAAAALSATAERANTDLHSAPPLVQADHAPIIAATLAGRRVVAVGDYGIVILSDDGKAYRQASKVPTRTVLTSVYFLDDKNGWAADHDGTVLATHDGGDTWQLLREEPGKERALMSVWFENAQHGLAVGQFGLVLETDDAGKTWQERHLVSDAEQGEKHLMQIFAGPQHTLFVAAEGGAVFRSDDAGRHWAMRQTDNKGSFWTGLALRDGSLLVAGLRGHVYRSTDSGQQWAEVPSGTQQSLTAMHQGPDGKVQLVGMSGVVLTSADQGQHFTLTQRADRSNLTTLVAGPAGLQLFSLAGTVAAN
jgi:photosystem II stability/assembly factor-like uncharacterized protein